MPKSHSGKYTADFSNYYQIYCPCLDDYLTMETENQFLRWRRLHKKVCKGNCDLPNPFKFQQPPKKKQVSENENIDKYSNAKISIIGNAQFYDIPYRLVCKLNEKYHNDAEFRKILNGGITKILTEAPFLVKYMKF